MGINYPLLYAPSGSQTDQNSSEKHQVGQNDGGLYLCFFDTVSEGDRLANYLVMFIHLGEQLCQTPVCLGYPCFSCEIKNLLFHQPVFRGLTFPHTAMMQKRSTTIKNKVPWLPPGSSGTGSSHNTLQHHAVHKLRRDR